MTVNSVGTSPEVARAPRPHAEGPATAPEPRDRVEIGGAPRLMVGAPTGRLAPQIPPVLPYPTPVALEIDRGIGFSLDGEALVVGHDGLPGRIEITGHLADGTYPQRDFTVVRDGRITVIDGYFNVQDYTITHDGGATVIDGAEPRLDSTVRQEGNRTVVDNQFPAGRYQIDTQGNVSGVDCDWDGCDYLVTTEGNRTHIAGPIRSAPST